MPNDNHDGNAQPPAEVGYGRPPKSGQFKPGRSGNPKGRPKGTKGLASMIREQALQKIDVQMNGRGKSMTYVEAILTRMMRDAVSGKRGALDQAMRLLERHLPSEDTDPPLMLNAKNMALSELDTMLRLIQKAEGMEAEYWLNEERSLTASYEEFLRKQRDGLYHGETFESYHRKLEQDRRMEQRELDDAEGAIRDAILARVIAGPNPILPPPK